MAGAEAPGDDRQLELILAPIAVFAGATSSDAPADSGASRGGRAASGHGVPGRGRAILRRPAAANADAADHHIVAVARHAKRRKNPDLQQSCDFSTVSAHDIQCFDKKEMVPHPLCARLANIIVHIGSHDTSTHAGWAEDCDEDLRIVYEHVLEKGKAMNSYEATAQAISVSRFRLPRICSRIAAAGIVLSRSRRHSIEMAVAAIRAAKHLLYVDSARYDEATYYLIQRSNDNFLPNAVRLLTDALAVAATDAETEAISTILSTITADVKKKAGKQKERTAITTKILQIEMKHGMFVKLPCVQSPDGWQRAMMTGQAVSELHVLERADTHCMVQALTKASSVSAAALRFTSCMRLATADRLRTNDAAERVFMQAEVREGWGHLRLPCLVHKIVEANNKM
eukprot:4441668-Pyramimonas_sp.AAC.1